MVGAGGAEWKEALGEICISESDAGGQFREWYGPRSGEIMVGNEDETTDKRVVRIEERLGDGDGLEAGRPWACLSFHAVTQKAVEAEEVDLFVASKPVLRSNMMQIVEVAKW